MPRHPKLPAPNVLAVDGDHGARRALALQLEALGCKVAQAASRAEALGLASGEPFTLAICDIGVAGSGLDLLPELLSAQPGLSVVVMARDPAVDTVAEAVRKGAKDFLSKPLTSVQVRRLVEDARDRAGGAGADGTQDLLELAVTPAVRDLVRRAASRDDSVLIRGEQGTWKGAVARAIHERGVHRGGPFVEVGARTVRDPEELLRNRAAEGGTLVVDEVGDLSRPLQEALLLVLHGRADGGASPHGGIRVLATTSRDLAASARAGVFSRALLHELAAIEIDLPPLRSRPRDILPLAVALAERFALQRGGAPPTLSPTARRLLVTWPWPRNVRELREVVERAVSAAPGRVLGTDAFPDWMAARAGDAPIVGASLTLQELEREHVTRVLAWASTFVEAAHVLGMDPSTVRRKLKRWERRARKEKPTPRDESPSTTRAG